jgi:hypothetical protein
MNDRNIPPRQDGENTAAQSRKRDHPAIAIASACLVWTPTSFWAALPSRTTMNVGIDCTP